MNLQGDVIYMFRFISEHGIGILCRRNRKTRAHLDNQTRMYSVMLLHTRGQIEPTTGGLDASNGFIKTLSPMTTIFFKQLTMHKK